jgi:hypothetical protein
MSKWIHFWQVLDEKRKTKIFAVVAKEGGIPLGSIKWFGRWRKYAFFPQPNTVFETQCLTDIVEFINKLMEERKHAKANNISRTAEKNVSG